MPQVCIIGPSRHTFLSELLKDSLLNHYRDPQMEGNPQSTRRIACLGMKWIPGVFFPPSAVFIRVTPKPIVSPIRSYCTIADRFSRFLRVPPPQITLFSPNRIGERPLEIIVTQGTTQIFEIYPFIKIPATVMTTRYPQSRANEDLPEI